MSLGTVTEEFERLEMKMQNRSSYVSSETFTDIWILAIVSSTSASWCTAQLES